MSNPVITRNGVSKTFTEKEFGKKSKDNAGKKYFAPEVTEESFDTDVIWVGKGDLIQSVNRFLRSTFAGIFLDNVDEKTGEFNEAQWQLDAAEFTAGVDKLSEIEEELDELQAKQQVIVLSDDFGAEEVVQTSEGPKSVKTAKAQDLEQQMKAIADQIRPLRIKRATIEAKYKERADKRKATKAAAEAAAAAAKQAA